MDDIEFKQMWASLNEKQETTLKVNQKIIENASGLRVKSLLNSMKPTKLFLIIIGILWVLFLDTVIINTFGEVSAFFTISAIIQVLLTKLSIGIYLYQIIMIQQVDISQPITVAQEKLLNLKSSTLWVARILWLQLPVWSTFYLHPALFTTENLLWLIFQAIATFSLLYLSIWLFININFKNKEKKWFKWLFDNNEWNPVIKSMELIDDLKEFKN
ncbi:hypothetical protein GCM10011514_01340 [Emticicia aquatilis]|uniref:Uncharacterized protein n=1 Tax=Emticicia aquatilis TaxID=1537369 RepID=A0A916YF92_9BACT|nr:hypothetical protein [Emticicia aquatilis]GGD41003.1 hypothetical protein GCM10011514_01340 [Emticicia aquatilis]